MLLKFASYNIHKAVGGDRRRDPGRIIAVLKEIDADIIALQEADLRIGQRASVLPRALIDDTPWKIVPVARRPRSIGWHGNAILVRRSIEVLAAQAIELPRLEPRGAVWADLLAGTMRLRVFGTHLDLSGLRRRDQIKAILDQNRALPGPYPAIIMGDFNQWGLQTGAMKAFGPAWQSLMLGKSFPSRQPLASLDRILASQEWHSHDSGVHHSAVAVQASDHLPVWANLRLLKK